MIILAAAPFKATLIFKNLTTGARRSYTCTVSDVAAALYIFPSGLNFLTLTGSQKGWALIDVMLSAAGTDTTQASIFVNQRSTPETIQNASNLNTNLARQFLSSPMGFNDGSTVQFIQAA